MSSLYESLLVSAYRLFGRTGLYRSLARRAAENGELFMGAGFRIDPRLYAGAYLLPLLLFPLFFAPTYVLVTYVIPVPGGWLLALGVGLAATVVSALLALYYPKMRYKSRGALVTSRLPRLLLLMSALSAGGMPLLRTMMIAHRARDLIGIDVELDYVGRHILMGDSLSDALRQVARLTPSPRFREYLEGLAGIAETGVNVYDYNRAFLGRVFMEFREALRDLVEKMSLVMEILVSIGVILPILVVTLVLFVGRYMRLPADPGALAGLFAFVVVPLIFIVLAIMVDAMITKVYG